MEAKVIRRERQESSRRAAIAKLGAMQMAPTGILAGAAFEPYASVTGLRAGGVRRVHTSAGMPADGMTPASASPADLLLADCGRFLDGYDQSGAAYGPASVGPRLRHALPSPCVFTSKCKRRWVGRRALDVLCEEFSWRPREYWEDAARDGLLLVNGGPVTPDTVLDDASVTQHLSWRFEPPVLDTDPRILAVTAACVAVEKPPSLPMHPGGGYSMLSLQRALECRAPHLGVLRPVHRLDRVTGGVVLFARSSGSAHWLAQLMHRRFVSKTYVALVRGRFPAGPPDGAEWRTSPVPDAPGVDDKPPGEDTDGAFRSLPWPPALEDAPWLPCAEASLSEDSAAACAELGIGQEALMRWVRLPADEWSGEDGSGGGDTTHTAVRPPLPASVDAEGPWLLLGMPLSLERSQTANGGVTGVAAPTPSASSSSSSADAGSPKTPVTPSEGGMEGSSAVRAAGKRSVTLARRLAAPFRMAGEWWSLVAARPMTGRTHQIRIHLASAGFGIGNDPLYGDATPLPGAPPAVDVAPRRGVPDPEAAALEAAGGDPAAMPRSPPWADQRVNTQFCVRSYSAPAPVLEHGPEEEAALRIRLIEAEQGLRRAAEARRTAAAMAEVEEEEEEELEDPWDGAERVRPAKRVRAAMAAGPWEPLGDAVGSADPSNDLSSPDVAAFASVAAARDASWYRKYGAREDFSAAQLACLGVWLHSVRYRARTSNGTSWEFGCGLPSWAADAMAAAAAEEEGADAGGTPA